MKEHLGKLIVGIILLLVGAGVSYYIFRPSPLAFARCEPLRGDAPLRVSCDNESNYHRHVVWDFGEQASPQIKDRDRVEYQYRRKGQYKITLTAHGQGTPGRWEQLIDVLVPSAISSPISVSVMARTKENRVVESKVFQISQTKDDHPSALSDHSRTYTETFSADPGFRIVGATFRSSSAARAGDIKESISPDGSNITLSYRLTSGPAVDRYRGWLRGDLIMKQEQLAPANGVTLGAEISITRFGTYALPVSVTLDSVQNVSILSKGGQTLAFGEPHGVLVSQTHGLVFSLVENGGQLFLKVDPRN